MIKPISLRLRNAEILAQARAALGRGREQELKQANARVMKRAREIVARRQEQEASIQNNSGLPQGPAGASGAS
jgi:hypothetical protein